MEVDYRDFYLYMRDRRISGSEYSQRVRDLLNIHLLVSIFQSFFILFKKIRVLNI